MRPSLPAILSLAVSGALLFASARADADLEAARAGDAAAQVRLGYAFRDGKDGRSQNNRHAVAWFTRAAEQGDAVGLDNLGWLTEHGTGTPADPVRARDLYRQAAEKSNPQAMRNLARVLREGIGGDADDKSAYTWSRKALEIDPGERSERAVVEDLMKIPCFRGHMDVLEQLTRSSDPVVLARVAQAYQEGRGSLTPDEARAGVLFERARQAGLAANVLLPSELKALANAPDVKGAFAYLPTTHLDQGHNMCAPTSAAMALGFYRGTPADPYEIKRHSTGSERAGTGTSWDHLLLGVKHVSGRAWEFRSYPVTDAGFEEGFAVLRAEADAGRVALIDLGPHTVVFAGYNLAEQLVYIQNPAMPYPGVHTVTVAKLRETWQSPFHVTTQKVPARPLLLTGASVP